MDNINIGTQGAFGTIVVDGTEYGFSFSWNGNGNAKWMEGKEQYVTIRTKFRNARRYKMQSRLIKNDGPTGRKVIAQIIFGASA